MKNLEAKSCFAIFFQCLANCAQLCSSSAPKEFHLKGKLFIKAPFGIAPRDHPNIITTHYIHQSHPVKNWSSSFKCQTILTIG